MKNLLRITIVSSMFFLSVQTVYAQANKRHLESKIVHKPTRLDSLNQMIKNSLMIKAKYIKAGKDTMLYANSENEKLQALLEKNSEFANSEQAKQMANNIYQAQQANTYWGNMGTELDVVIRNLENERTSITGTIGSPKMNIKRMPVKVDEKSGKITF
jgi:hypothetical protein